MILTHWLTGIETMLRRPIRRFRRNRRQLLRLDRGQRRHRLQVASEPLEMRLMLNGQPAGFNLTNGNLYNTSGSEPLLIDNSVLNFSVVSSKVFDLHADGTLDSLNSDGSAKSVVDSNVQSFGFAAQGQLLVLAQNGMLANWGTAQSPIYQFTMDTGAASVAIAPLGAVLELNQDGDSRSGQGTETIGRYCGLAFRRSPLPQAGT